MRLNKKGISTVVTTILLILLVIAAFSVMTAFLIPMIKNKLAEGECFKILGKLKVVEGAYTCYNSTIINGQIIKETRIMIEIENTESENITEIVFSLSGSGSAYGINSAYFKIKKGDTNDNIRMYDKSYGESLDFPDEKTSALTYVFKTEFDVESADIAPVIDKLMCKKTSYEIKKC